MALTFLLRTFLRTNEKKFPEVVDHTLAKMAWGRNCNDQLGGVFPSILVDARGWSLTLKKRMLYDQWPLMSRVYLDAILLTHEMTIYRRIAEGRLWDYGRHAR